MTAMPRGYSARQVAARVVARAHAGGAFAAAVLDSELARAVQLDGRDRALATELVYGSLRVEPWLDDEIGRFTKRRTAIDASVRAHLIIAAYQLFFTRVPAFAAVSEAVSSVRSERGSKVAAFANAVLRRVAERAVSMESSTRDGAVFASTPPWLREALERALSVDGSRAFLRCGDETPAIALRAESADQRHAWLARLRGAVPTATFEAGRISPRSILVRGAGKPEALPGYAEGAWSVQEEGAQFAALAVGAQEGEAVLDACAGRGNKTAVLARAVGQRGAVDACDSNPRKLERLALELRRLGLAARDAFAIDWTVGSGGLTRTYDRVLVDAPCTGVGTLRRRPDIVLHRSPGELESISRTQRAIAFHAASHVRVGGTLVYVVCSVLREECEEVVKDLVAELRDFEAAPFDAAVAGSLFGEAASLRLLPHLHGTDGYFIACLRRKA
jgi:16S rRNA (cytosine967-C5)-methyltransferase